jgi:hypothetical protein
MPRATHTLLPRTKSFKPVGVSAIHILARLAAKKAIQEKLRADGVRLTLVPPREIAEQAQRYLAEHPELYREALEREPSSWASSSPCRLW